MIMLTEYSILNQETKCSSINTFVSVASSYQPRRTDPKKPHESLPANTDTSARQLRKKVREELQKETENINRNL